MWISKYEYEELKEYKHLYDGMCIRHKNLQDMVTIELDCTRDYIKNLTNELEQMKEYKQKYADEVNKRLELIEYYERQTNN